MEHLKLSASVFPLLALTACATQQPLQAIDVRAISSVQSEIKRQVGVYMIASQKNPRPIAFGDYQAKRQDKEQKLFWCGSGAIGFDISTIKAELTTTLDTTAGVGAGIKTPIITFASGLKTEAINAQTLDYNLWPLPWADQLEEFKDQFKGEGEGEKIRKAIDEAPIAKVLLALRDALILSAMKYDYSQTSKKVRPPQPCFKDYNPDKPAADAGNSFKIALSFTYDASGNITLALATPISPTFSLSGESKSTTGNSITVSFIQQGVLALQKKKDAADKACADPIKDQKACDKATKEYEDEKNRTKELGENLK